MLPMRPVTVGSAVANLTKNSCSSGESARPPLSAPRTTSASRPLARTSPETSASAFMAVPTMIWLSSFTVWPAPEGPQWVRRAASADSTVVARATS